MFLYSGVIRPLPESETSVVVTPLVQTGLKAGTITQQDLNSIERSGLSRATETKLRLGESTGAQVLAAWIEGKASGASDPKAAEKKDGEEGALPAAGTRAIKAVYVADVDCLTRTFVDIRNRPQMLEDIKFQFQNITFVLNAIDVLAGETKYPQVRRHIPTFSTLKLVEAQAEKARQIEASKRAEFSKNFTEAIAKAEDENAKSEREFKERIDKLASDGSIDASQFADLERLRQQAAIKQQNTVKRFRVEKDRLQRERDQGIRNARREADDAISKIQNYYKLLAVFVPPIPPLVVGIVVLVSRRLREREGISKNRLK